MAYKKKSLYGDVYKPKQIDKKSDCIKHKITGTKFEVIDRDKSGLNVISENGVKRFINAESFRKFFVKI